MSRSNNILFEKEHNGKPLFNSQLDLINALLSDPQSKFYIPSSDPEQFAKAQNRLRTYISQVLSITVSRNITDDFIYSLPVVISSKLNGNKAEAEKLSNEIIESIKEKNTAIARSETKPAVLIQFISDLRNAQYIAIMTSRPLEIDAPVKEGVPTLRTILFSDLINSLYDRMTPVKNYRFNFPTETSGRLFWRGIRRILFRQFRSNPIVSLLESLNKKSIISDNKLFEMKNLDPIPDTPLLLFVDEILTTLNANKNILVFITTAPIYSLPTIAIDPNATNNKIYTILDSDKMALFKFPDDETLLWRLFVWDSLKSRYPGQALSFSIE